MEALPVLRAKLLAALLAAAWIVHPHSCRCELYRYVDGSGAVHFTDDAAKVPSRLRKESRRPEDIAPSAEEKSFFEGIDSKPDGSAPKELKLAKKAIRARPPAEKRPTYIIGPDGAQTRDLRIPSSASREESRNPRLSTPEGAVAEFRRGMREGDARLLESCTTREFWERIFDRVPRDRLRRSESEIFSIVKVKEDPDHAEFHVVFIDAQGKQQSYVMTTDREEGDWKVSRF